MKISELVKLRQSLIESLETVESELDKLRSPGVEKRILHYSDNSFIYIKPQILALALILDAPDIPAEELARQVGVNKTTLYRWNNVAKYLRARQKMQRSVQLPEEK